MQIRPAIAPVAVASWQVSGCDADDFEISLFNSPIRCPVRSINYDPEYQ
jgi:hypothetical protein